MLNYILLHVLDSEIFEKKNTQTKEREYKLNKISIFLNLLNHFSSNYLYQTVEARMTHILCVSSSNLQSNEKYQYAYKQLYNNEIDAGINYENRYQVQWEEKGETEKP